MILIVRIELGPRAFRRNVDLHTVDGDGMHNLLRTKKGSEIHFEGKCLHDEHRRDVPIPSMPERYTYAVDATHRAVTPAQNKLHRRHFGNGHMQSGDFGIAVKAMPKSPLCMCPFPKCRR